MRVFLTGATGFIGSYLVPELIGAGHRVTGLTRSDAGMERLAAMGAEPVRGDLGDLPALRRAASGADAVIHAAFEHDFSNLRQHSEHDRAVIAALADALAGSDRPLVISSGTGLARRNGGAAAVETDPAVSSAEYPRAATEEAADAAAARGVRAIVVRLSQVHDTRHAGRIGQHIKLGREKGYVAHVGAGANRLAAVHVRDAVRLYRLALDAGSAGERFNAVGEEGVALREIAAVIGAGLNVPVRPIAQAEAPAYFGPLADLVGIDLPASSAATRAALGWTPSGPDLLTDLRRMDYC